ncbi:MAG: YlbF family regulator [Acidobacteriota bacterium]
MTRDEIIRKAFELGATIADSEEMQVFRQMQAEVMKDAEAYSLVQRYQEAREQAAEMMEQEVIIPIEDEEYLSHLEEELQNNPIVKDLLVAQDSVTNLLNAVYFAIDQAVNGPSCEGEDCSSCGGSCC